MTKRDTGFLLIGLGIGLTLALLVINEVFKSLIGGARLESYSIDRAMIVIPALLLLAGVVLLLWKPRRQRVMIEYRVTKYDPALRDARGAYIADEWTSMADIGREFGGVVLTDDEYRRVEQAYINSAVAFLQEGGLNSLTVKGLENHKEHALEFGEGSVLSLEQAGDIIRRILREEFWCRLECRGGFAHFGWDYYMYIGVPHRCPEAEHLAEGLGLYPEKFTSPYKEKS